MLRNILHWIKSKLDKSVRKKAHYSGQAKTDITSTKDDVSFIKPDVKKQKRYRKVKNNRKTDKILRYGVIINYKKKTYSKYLDSWYKIDFENNTANPIRRNEYILELEEIISKEGHHVILKNRHFVKIENEWYYLNSDLTPVRKVLDNKKLELLEIQQQNYFDHDIYVKSHINDSDQSDKIKIASSAKQYENKNGINTEIDQNLLPNDKSFNTSLESKSNEQIGKLNKLFIYLESGSFLKYNIPHDFIENKKNVLDLNSKYELTTEETGQLIVYLWIYKTKNCEEHWHVNRYITKNSNWDDFSELRSINNHGDKKIVEGITPKYFAIICHSLNIGANDGAPLINYEKY